MGDKLKFAKKWRQRKDAFIRLLDLDDKELYGDFQLSDKLGLDYPWEIDKFDDFYKQSADTSLANFLEETGQKSKDLEKKAAKSRKRKKKRKAGKNETVETTAQSTNLTAEIPELHESKTEIIRIENEAKAFEISIESEEENLEMEILLDRYRNYHCVFFNINYTFHKIE